MQESQHLGLLLVLTPCLAPCWLPLLNHHLQLRKQDLSGSSSCEVIHSSVKRSLEPHIHECQHQEFWH